MDHLRATSPDKKIIVDKRKLALRKDNKEQERKEKEKKKKKKKDGIVKSDFGISSPSKLMKIQSS